MIKFVVVFFLCCSAYMQLRGRVRHAWFRQIFDHSSFTAPINVFMLAFSGVPRTPYIDRDRFADLKVLEENWQEIRKEGENLLATEIKAAQNHDDAGFNSFFKKGWKRFYIKWYGDAHPSARALCPLTTELVSKLPSVKAAMFAYLPDGGKLGLHRDPYAGSLRYHLGLVTPNNDLCYIAVDGQRYSWRDGEGVVFDETFLHYAENTSGQGRIVLFCDIERPMKYRWAQGINRWIATHIVAAGASPNSEGDRTGGVNRVFRYVHFMGEKRRAFKRWNKTVYRITKFALIVGALGLIWVLP
ncbi:MAG TPA: aspartyl/asparaginyl beta-hydroxylase domain-containing protein [Burkholderiales bacterium]|nr:aspartyl/asparaginyl beta-hydroxylase domain-containing protein [Burkholderiales bacterium]